MDATNPPPEVTAGGPPAGDPLAACLAERNRLWADAREAESLRLELFHARKIIDEMKASASWRITTPLRRTKELRASVRSRLGRLRRAVR
ncbi:MAG: hypothetical protein JWR63_3694 [Conexibacter sp.]|nr:hypothetical protein [Conexibacter sp.]